MAYLTDMRKEKWWRDQDGKLPDIYSEDSCERNEDDAVALLLLEAVLVLLAGGEATTNATPSPYWRLA